jgi:2-methylisocitrate lyase-like PEP mutase family enzyme
VLANLLYEPPHVAQSRAAKVHAHFEQESRMSTQQDRAAQFHQLHVKGEPVILFNIWDAGSAQAVARAGAKAVATGSWSVAAANGVADGEALARETALENAARIVAAVSLPVTIDFEAGYGKTADEVGESVARLLDTGAIGINIEDRFIDRPGLQSVSDQAARLRAARAAADRAGVNLFINARTDIFLNAPAASHSNDMVSEAIARAHAYAQAGASGFFVPGLVDETLIERVCRESPLPVNIMMMNSAPPVQRLRTLGVMRISHGPGPYRMMLRWLEEATKETLAALSAQDSTPNMRLKSRMHS